MIDNELLSNPELEAISVKRLLSSAYSKAGIPNKYHFEDLETGWSTEFSPLQKLTELGKKRSTFIKKFIQCYIDNIANVLSGGGIKYTKNKKSKYIKSLILVGSYSSGKTMLLSLIAQASINNGYKTLFFNWSDFVHRFQNFSLSETDEILLNVAMNCDLLVIDSVRNYDIVGMKNFQTMLDRLISQREINDKVTICSIDTSEDSDIPIYKFAWNQYIRNTPHIKLPEASTNNENKSKRS